MIAASHRKAWLNWLSIEKRYGENTVSAYEADLDDFCAFVALLVWKGKRPQVDMGSLLDNSSFFGSS